MKGQGGFSSALLGIHIEVRVLVGGTADDDCIGNVRLGETRD